MSRSLHHETTPKERAENRFSGVPTVALLSYPECPAIGPYVMESPSIFCLTEQSCPKGLPREMCRM